MYNDLANVQYATENPFKPLSEAANGPVDNTKVIEFHTKQLKLASEILTTTSFLAHLDGLEVLGRFRGYIPVEEQLGRLTHLEPRKLLNETKLNVLRGKLVPRYRHFLQQKATLILEAKKLSEVTLEDMEEVNRQLEIKPTDSWLQVVGKAKTLRDFGRITEAVGAFSRYADMFSATDPTAKKYSEIAVQFTLQLDSLRVKGGMSLYELNKDGAAERAGLQAGDIVISYDGKLTPGNPEFIPAMKDAHTGEPVKIEYFRMDEKGKFQRHTVTLPGGSLGAGAMPI